MLVIFRTRNEDWERFKTTLQEHEDEIKSFGCTRIEARRNRKHPDEWVMLQEWPDKQTFDKFAAERGPELDKEAGVRWTDVSTWLEEALPV
jgi:quinol monooxygenase YgiN